MQLRSWMLCRAFLRIQETSRCSNRLMVSHGVSSSPHSTLSLASVKWFIAFLELKATGSLKLRSQAQHVEELAIEARKGKSTLGLLEALKEGQSESDELAIVLKEEDTARFFGLLAAVHKAIRQAFPWYRNSRWEGPKPNTAVWRAGKGR